MAARSGRARGGSPRESLRAVFLDRDGTINWSRTHVNTVEEIELMPAVPEALIKLKAAGLILVVVTNQAGVAMGFKSLDTLKKQNGRVDLLLRMAGAPAIDAYYWCVHGTRDGCSCRKPKPGMLTRAALELGIDLDRSYMVGDRPSDAEAGRAAGVRGVFSIGARGFDSRALSMVDLISPSLSVVADAILAMDSR